MINFAAKFRINTNIGKKIILVTGGQRSGKSRLAEQLALNLADNPVYVATAHIWDDEFRERVQ